MSKAMNLQKYAALLWECSGRREDAPFIGARDHAAQVYAEAREAADLERIRFEEAVSGASSAPAMKQWVQTLGAEIYAVANG